MLDSTTKSTVIMKTKGFILAIAMVITTISTVVGQNQNIEWGIKAGPNYSTTTSELDSEYIFGYHAGFVAELKIAPKFSIQPELFYSLEGGRTSFDFSFEEMSIAYEEKAKLGYLNLPIMMKYFVTPGLSIQAGPQVGYLLSAKSNYEIATNFLGFPINESGTEDIKGDLKKISLGLNFGLGYEFQNNIFLQARYVLGLNDISNFDEETGDDSEEGFEEEFEELEGDMEKLKISGFQLSIGFIF